MKTSHVALILSFALPCLLPAQTTNAPSADASAPAAPTIPTTQPDNSRYLKKPGTTKYADASLAAIHGKPCDIIFIGDSITQHWQQVGKETWDKVYAPRNALDFGVSGDTTQNVLWRLDNTAVKDLKPKVAVVLIGTNNYHNQPQEIADGVKAVLDKTQAMYPGVKIILVSIMPNGRANARMMATDEIIKNDADNKTIFYLDLVPLMPAVKSPGRDGKLVDNFKGLGPDRLHPDASGYVLWSDAMEPLLSKLLAESK